MLKEAHCQVRKLWLTALTPSPRCNTLHTFPEFQRWRVIWTRHQKAQFHLHPDFSGEIYKGVVLVVQSIRSFTSQPKSDFPMAMKNKRLWRARLCRNGPRPEHRFWYFRCYHQRLAERLRICPDSGDDPAASQSFSL